MAVHFKPGTFGNIVKRFTVCGLCNGKISEGSFFLCGCKDIICLHCHEKHYCEYKWQAIKYSNYKDCKSISFIHDLNEVFKNQHGKGKEKIISQRFENSSPTTCLPDLDDVVNETQGEVSFSQLFDDVRCFRDGKPKCTYGGNKRESISPRITYTQKRKQYLSDTDDEDVFEKSELITPKNKNKKRIIKKRKHSSKIIESSLVSTAGCGTNSCYQHNKKVNFMEKRNCEVTDVSLAAVDTDTGSPLPKIPSSLMCLGVEETNSSTENKTFINVVHGTESKSTYCKEFVNREYTGILCNANPQDLILHDKTVMKTENEISSKVMKDERFSGSSHNSDDIDNIMLNVLDHVSDSSATNKTVNHRTYKPKFYNSNLKQTDNDTSNHDKESACKEKPDRTYYQKLRNKDKIATNKHLRDFDGFDQCEINGSTLNYLFYKLTTSLNGDDEMVFPMNYKGKKIFIHVGSSIENKTSDNEYHFLLGQIVDVKVKYTQTDDDKRNFDVCSGLNVSRNQEVQTDSFFSTEHPHGVDNQALYLLQGEGEGCVMKDASIGPDVFKNQELQTDPCLVTENTVGPDAGITAVTQTDSFHVVDACAGPGAAVTKFSQTESYQVRDSCTSPMNFKTTEVQTDLHYITSSTAGSDMSILSGESCVKRNISLSPPKIHLAQNELESAQLTKNGYSLDSPTEVEERPDNGDDEIIEGTPVKVNNISFSSLNLSAVREHTLHFDLNNGSPETRNEVVSCSNLTNKEKEVVQKFIKSFGMGYTEYFTNKTTHLVVSSRFSYQTHKTFKYLLAIASKACVVSLLWVIESLETGKILPIDEYIPTNYSGPLRCRLNVQPPFSGLTICSQLFTSYPGVRPTEALCRLCGAFVVEDIGKFSSSEKWPFPRFCLFENESDLSCQILNNCSKNLIVAIHCSWVFDSVAAYQRLPIIKHLSSTFNLTDDIIEAYKIPTDMIVEDIDVKE